MDTLGESPKFLPRSSSWHQAAHQAPWALLWCPGRPRLLHEGHRPKDTIALCLCSLPHSQQAMPQLTKKSL